MCDPIVIFSDELIMTRSEDGFAQADSPAAATADPSSVQFHEYDVKRRQSRGIYPPLLATTAMPSTAVAVSLTLFGAKGIDRLNKAILHFASDDLFYYGLFSSSLMISIFITTIARELNWWQKIIVFPINFCVLSSLSLAAHDFYVLSPPAIPK
jgi:hypothetical protein